MSGGAKRLARLAVLTALGAGLLILAGAVPSGKLGLMLVASFPVCVALMQYGAGWAAAVYAVTAALGFLLFPSGAGTLGYAVFFGYYPIAKSLFERLHRVWLSWILKLLLYSAAFLVLYLGLSWVLLIQAETLPWYVLLLIGAAAFVVYDLCYSMAIRIYLDKLARYIS